MATNTFREMTGLKIVKERELKHLDRVFVYYNLHKKCFSIRSMKTGLVVAHADKVYMSECTFKVSEAGRQRVLKEKKKNVHAGIIGKWLECAIGTSETATYNPFKYDSFVEVRSGKKVEKANWVRLEGKQIHYL